VEVSGSQWKSVEVSGSQWKSVEVSGSQWKSAEKYSWILGPNPNPTERLVGPK